MAPIFTGSKFGFSVGGQESGGILASGGTKISEPDGYTYHYFTSPGTFSGTTPFTVEYIVIGGGGAGSGQPGGNNYGGGGAGAGGWRTGSTPVTTSPYPITVGATKPAPPLSYSGAYGNPSSAFTITSEGGGSGGGYNQSPTNDYNGGSGGGAPHYAPSTVGLGNRVVGTATPAPAQGNNGGPGGGSASGGGGGGGGVGGASGSSTGGNGGIGVAFPTWTIPPSYGTPGPNPTLRYFAGGGGGAGNSAGGSGGYGGGGAGAASANGTAGTLNTGGGGGSCGGNGSLTGGPGGSGIIIVRYLT